MSDQEKVLETDIARGNLAKQLKENPLLQELIITMKAEIYRNFEKTDFKEKDERDEQWRQLKTVVAFERRIQTIYEQGELSIKFLDKMKRKLKNGRQAR